MPRDNQKPAVSRKRPISCQFCRSRKLRCSRTAPCANCVSRGIDCDLQYPVAQPANSGTADPDVTERLERLERLLLTKQGEGPTQTNSPPGAEKAEQQRPTPASSLARTVDDDDNSWPGIFDTAVEPSSMHRVVIRTCPISKIGARPSYILRSRSPVVEESELSRCIWLPHKDEAQILLQKYICVAQHLPYVTHIPTLTFLLERLYSDLAQRHPVQTQIVILFLGIFAAATHSWVNGDSVRGLFPTHTEANDQAVLWARAVEIILDVADETSKISLEAVQGAVITSYIVAQIQGHHKHRVLFGLSVILARELGLHRIDHPSNAAVANTAQSEMGRRLWWFICSFDWSTAARTSGLAEGVYTCHPRQMITRKPLNINDEEVFDGMNRDERSLSQPTPMSFTMQTIRLAEVSRGIIDRNPLAMCGTGGLSLDAVMNVDTELQGVINDVPQFYSMDADTLMRTYAVSNSQAESIVLSGKLLYVLIYVQRCKLHIPYLMRKSDEPEYYASREICIKYARLIIRSELWKEDLDRNTATRLRFSTLMVGTFLACVVLLLDLSANPCSPSSKSLRDDIERAFQVIEKAKRESQNTSKVFGSLVNILRRNSAAAQVEEATDHQHQFTPGGGWIGDVQHNSQAGLLSADVLGATETTAYTDDYSMMGFASPSGQLEVSDGGDIAMATGGSGSADEEDFLTYWSNFTQNFEQGIDVDAFDWDSIFMDLDTSI